VPVSLPERTVDSWTSVYLAQRLPNVLLWAPTQMQHPDYDLAGGLPGRGKLFVLENKGPYTRPNAGHGFDLSMRQLYNYLRHPALRDRTFYILPCPPYPTSTVPAPLPAPPSAAPVLLPARATARLPGHIWAPPGGCEDWFSVAAAADVWALTGLPLPTPGDAFWMNGSKGPPGTMVSGIAEGSTVSIDCPLAPLPTSSLRRFVDDLVACRLGGLLVDPDDSLGDAMVVDSDEGSTLDTSLVAFAQQIDFND
jgi:hypothetical protein